MTRGQAWPKNLDFKKEQCLKSYRSTFAYLSLGVMEVGGGAQSILITSSESVSSYAIVIIKLHGVD